MPRTALALAALSAAAFLLSGCIFVDVERGGGHYEAAARPVRRRLLSG